MRLIEDCKLFIIYYIFINPDKYKIIVGGQLKDIIKSCIIFSKIYIHICSENKSLIDQCKKFIINLIPQFEIDTIFSESYQNQFEYQGLKLLYDLSQQKPENNYLYIHSKGMVYNNPINERNEFERTTLRGTLYYHQKAMEIFKNIININKIGLWPSEKGFIWVNFFYIRGSYLKIPPIITKDRWWYEEYINQSGNYFDCYSLIKDKVIGFHPDLIKNDQLLINQIDKKF